MMSDAPLYEPSNPDDSRIFQFIRRINNKYQLTLNSYSDLYKWSTTEIDQFWGSVWDETPRIIGEKGGHVVDRTAKPSDNPTWFSGAKLNWAENMLHCRSEKVALIQASAPVSFQF